MGTSGDVVEPPQLIEMANPSVVGLRVGVEAVAVHVARDPHFALIPVRRGNTGTDQVQNLLGAVGPRFKLTPGGSSPIMPRVVIRG